MANSKQGYSWDAFIDKNELAFTVPSDMDVTLNNLPSSPSAQYGTLNAINIIGDVTIKGPGSVAAQAMADNSNGTYTLDGASLTLNQGSLPVTTINLTNGSSFTATNSYNVDSNSEVFSVNFGPYVKGNTNSLKLVAFVNAVTVTNFKPGDIIDLVASYIIDDVHLVNTDTPGILNLVDSSGQRVINGSIHTAKDPEGNYYTASDFQAVKSSDGYEIICFLAGSMIRTSGGDVAVEDIQVGDEVIAFDWKYNKEVPQSVVWAGKAHAIVRPELHDDEAGWPVCILKDAIADNVPYKNMLLTAEHCLFFKDRFVPVRMLVNGVSIFYDKSITSYDYYHVETERHSVITADGMLTESYLDTGNRSSFSQKGKVVRLSGAVRSWEEDAGAPLSVDRSFVEPLYRALEWRETCLGNSTSGNHASAPKPELTSDPDLHLVTNKGAIIRPMRQNAQHYSFMVPADTKSVHVVSRASRPSDVIGPFVDDRRCMGVAVGEVRLFCAKQQLDITSHLTAEKPAGWHADMGWDGVAWTNGNAELPLGDHLSNGKMGILSITVRAAGPYIKDNQTTTKSVKSA